MNPSLQFILTLHFKQCKNIIQRLTKEARQQQELEEMHRKAIEAAKMNH